MRINHLLLYSGPVGSGCTSSLLSSNFAAPTDLLYRTLSPENLLRSF